MILDDFGFYNAEIRRNLNKELHSLVDHANRHIDQRDDYPAHEIIKSIISQYSARRSLSDKQRVCLAKFIFYIQHIQPVPPRKKYLQRPVVPPSDPKKDPKSFMYSPFGNPNLGSYEVREGLELVAAYINKQQSTRHQSRVNSMAMRAGLSVHRIQI
ncbi:hypothetical protein GZH47_33200 (plasmid) [Paenibacillus rhizovicinus]|uniref:Uncharacterized protein n=1 Tax=Paenibacillus rhizovicinus TaxID=2704463 RepID=A0A6C0PCY8_9BACL|nr:hypothetical protein [Paenibacillus rhizovicinus]QHW35752.1 hypothetical protein GZH47_33200 [Paenibacillus rhizovicinus]